MCPSTQGDDPLDGIDELLQDVEAQTAMLDRHVREQAVVKQVELDIEGMEVNDIDIFGDDL